MSLQARVYVVPKPHERPSVVPLVACLPGLSKYLELWPLSMLG